MSRSRRRPFVAPGSVNSARVDKSLASRGARRLYAACLRHALVLRSLDELDLPSRRGCPHNDVWTWSRDGRQRYVAPPRVCEFIEPDDEHVGQAIERHARELRWYARYRRK